MPLNIWIVKVWEPMPIDANRPRLLRAGLLARELVQHGHRVTWWNCRFEHFSKTQRPQRGTLEVEPNYRIVLLEGPSYRRNVSVQRLLNNMVVSANYAWQALLARPRPDLIVVALPTAELALLSVLLGRLLHIPVVVDARDQVPDIWVEVMRQRSRMPAWLLKLLVTPYQLMVRTACAGASGLTAVSEGFLQWALAKAGRARGPKDAVFYPSHGGVRAAAGPPQSLFTIFFAGILTTRILPQMLTVIEVVKELDVRLVVCGTGEAEAQMRQAGADCPRIHFTGRVGAEELARWMGESQVGLLPYPNASDFVISVPGKVAEYLAGGLPILTSLRGEVGRLVEENGCGIVYPESDPRALKEAIRRACSGLEELQQRARTMFAEKFNTEVVCGGFRRYLEHLAQEKMP